MRIPSKRKQLFRNFQDALFYKDYSYQERSYSFYLLLRPILEFIKVRLEGYLESEEIESVLYLMCIDVFNNFDKDKWSIVPYLENSLPWYISKVINEHKEQNIPVELAGEEEEYILDEEFYWRNILLEDTYVGKCFTRGEKYLIYNIIESDKKDLSVNALARKLNIKRWYMKKMLQELKDIFKLEEINVQTN